MKRILLFLTCVLTLFGVARAETFDVTLDITTFGSPGSYSAVTYNDSEHNISYGGAMITGTNPKGCMQMNSDSSGKARGALAVLSNSNYYVRKIQVTFATSGSLNIFLSNAPFYSSTPTDQAGYVGNPGGLSSVKTITSSSTYEITGDYSYWAIKANSASYITSIKVTYETSGGGNTGGEVTPPVDPDPTPGGDEYITDNIVTSNFTGISYTVSKNWTSQSSGATYQAQATSNNGFQMRTSRTTGITVTSAPQGMKVENITISFQTQGGGVTVYSGDSPFSIGNTPSGNGIKVTGSKTETISIDNPYFIIVPTSDTYTTVSEVVVNWVSNGGSEKETVTLSYDKNTYTATKGQPFNKPTLNVTPAEAASAVVYTQDNANVATVDATGAVTIKELGSTKITAEIYNNETYANASASYTLNVIKNGEYTVAEALTAIKNGYEGKAQVKGIITSIEEISEQYKNATYNISDDAAGTNSLQVFRGKWIDGADFSGNEIQVGGTIVVEGDLTNYNGTLEVGTGNVVISYIPPVTVAEDFTGFEKYESEGIELEVGDEVTLDLGDKYPVISYVINGDEGVISINDNKVKALSEGIVEVTASWEADDNWTAGSAEFMVDVTAAQLGEIIATVSDGTELVNDGTITISEGTTITFTAKNAKQIVLITVDDNVEDAEVNGDTLVWTPSLCEDEVVMVEAYMDPENTTSSATSYFEFTLTVTEKQYEKGTEQNPYTVTELNDNFSNAKDNNVWVTGYIVGSRNNNINYFGQSENHVATNLLLSDDAEATSSSLYIPVELQTTKNIRADLNVKDNANHIGRKVMLYGKADTYFSMNGLKSVTDYKFLDEETPDQTPELKFMYKGYCVNNDGVEVNWNATELPTLESPEGLELKFSSSDSSVAEINETTGEITLKDVDGETIISVTSTAVPGTWAEGYAEYTLKVNDRDNMSYTFDFIKFEYNMVRSTNGAYNEDGAVLANEEDIVINNYKNGSFGTRLHTTDGLKFYSGSPYIVLSSMYHNLDEVILNPENYYSAEKQDDGSWKISFSGSISGSAKPQDYPLKGITVKYSPKPESDIELFEGTENYEQSGSVDNDQRSITLSSLEDQVRVFIHLPEGSNAVPYYRVVDIEPNVKDPGKGGGQQSGGEDSMGGGEGPYRIRRAAQDWTQADVYDCINSGDDGKYYALLDNETKGTLQVYFKNEDGSTTAPVNYSFVVNREIPTGVETIVVGEGEVIYFDLNGRRVLNPDKGIFIKVEAGKVSKVIL